MLDQINVQFIVVGFLILTVSLVCHEFSHAFVADRLGDDTPRNMGRLTLNPVVLWQHHPFGSLVVPLLGAAMAGGLMGWAAVPVNPAGVDRKWTIRQANFLIAAAGPAANVLLALLGTLVLYALWSVRDQGWAQTVLFTSVGRSTIIELFIHVNIFLALFNLIPVAPLDGFRMLEGVAPQSWDRALAFLQEYALIILILFVMYGSQILGPATRFFTRLLYMPLAWL